MTPGRLLLGLLAAAAPAAAGWLPMLGLLTAAHARTWSAAPLLETSTRQATTWVFGENRWDDVSEWEDVAGLAVSVKTTKNFVLLSYHVGLEASYDADGELFMWEKFDPLTGGTVTQRRVGAGSFVESGRIQVRFVVDGVPLREGSGHVSATLTSKGRSKLEHIEGTAVLRPGNSTRDIRVQWKPSGKLLWSSSSSTGDGFMSGRVLAATAHDSIVAASPLIPAAITQKDWNGVAQSSLNVTLNETTAVRFGYALTISAAAPGPQMLASPLTADDYVQARLVVDNTPSDESVATLGTKERAASIAGVLARDVVLDMPKGTHSVRLEWRRAGNSPRLWRNDPNCLDGFGASRLVYASLSDYGVFAAKHAQVLAGMQYKRKTAKSITDIRAKSRQEWATVESDTFLVERDAQVLLQYALPVALHKLADWDAWTYSQLQAVQARLLVDGVVYREDASSVGGFQASGLHDDLRGALALPLLAGTHSCTLQWKSVGDETWYLASKHLGGTGKGVIDVVVDFRQTAFLQVVQESFSVKEDTPLLLKGISIKGVSFADNYDVSLSVQASSGDVLLGNAHNFTGPTKKANELLKQLKYHPCAECWGSDEVELLLVTEEGKAFNATLMIDIEPVDDVPELDAPELLEVESRVSLRGISVNDVDSEDEAYKMTLFALGGVFEGCEANATASSVLELTLSLDEMNACLQESHYKPLEGFAQAFVDNITLTLEDPGPSKHRLTEQVQVHAAITQSGPRIELPPYYELGLEGFIVEGDDANTTVSLTTDALDALLRLDSLEQGVQIDQTEHGLVLRGAAKAISTTLQSLTYVREPSFEGSDTITAVIKTSNASRTAKVAIDVRGGDETELNLVDMTPRRGFGGTRVLVSVLHADEFLQCQFGDKGAAKALKVDNETYECIAPAGKPGYASVRVHNRRFWSDPIQFLYEAPVKVLKVTPPVGAFRTPLLLEVDGVMPSPELTCHFADVSVRATRLDSTTVACTAPDLNGTVQVAVSTNGVDHGPSSLFEFVEVPSSLTLEPASGGLSSQMIRVKTDTRLRRLPHFCRFGLHETPAAVVDEYTLACEAPRDTEDAEVRVSVDGGASYGEAFAMYRRVDSAIAWIAPSIGSSGTLVTVGGRGFGASTRCRFGDVDVEASVVSAEELVCSAPIGNGTVAIGLLVDDVAVSSRHTFSYVEPTLLGSLSPNTGPTTGGTLVTIHGLRLADDASCKFGNASVPARWVSAEQIECAAPPHPIGVVDVTVAGEVLLYEYVEPLVPRAAYPSSGPAGGGTVVAVEGSGFAFSTRLKCRFGWTEVPATFVSEAEVRCAAPPGDAGPTALAVSGNGQDFVDVPAGFAYEAAPVVHGVAPPLGFAGTLVTLTGAGLGGVSACLFGDASTPATVVSDTEVRCAAPAGAGSLAVGASVNGVDAYASAARFRYVARPEVLSLEPASAGVEGGATVVVRGLRFPDSSLLACRFGATTAAARWVNATELECEAPPADASGPVAVEVSANGADFTADGAAFAYAATATVTGAGPLSGPATGGTEVVVRGANLVFSPSLACRFAFFDVPASFVGPTELRCAAPAQSAGAAAFAVVDDRRVLYEATFEYTPLMAVRGASPPRGAAGTSVTVAGSGFAAYATAACVFGDRRVEAVVTSDTEVTCEAPPGEGDVAVRVVSGATTAAGEAIFTYARAPSVSNLRPSTAAAGEPVTIYGADFVDASELACVFGDATTQARYVSSTELVCIAPVNEGVVDVAVTANGVEFGEATAFTYAATRIKFAPGSGPARGGTDVVIRGADFAPAARLACRFGATSVPAAFVDESTIACASPRGVSTVPLSLSRDGVAFSTMGEFAYDEDVVLDSLTPPLGSVGGAAVLLKGKDLPASCLFGDVVVEGTRTSTGIICRAPPGDGVVGVAATRNLVDPASSRLPFRYVADPVLSFVEPARAPVGSTITIRGVRFADSDLLKCRFGTTVATARYLDAARISCDVPAGAGSPIALALNGRDFFGNLSFHLLEDVSITKVSPRQAPAGGDVDVRIYGRGFAFSSHAACRFGSVKVPARVVNGTMLTCVAPSSEVGKTTLSMTLNGADFVDVSGFTYYAAPLIREARHTRGPLGGGASVQLVGDFPSGTHTTCRFGATIVDAALDGAVVSCEAPPSSTPGAVPLQLLLDGAAARSAVDLTYKYEGAVVLGSLSPTTGPTTGGTLVTIHGLRLADDASCEFGNTSVIARWVSAEQIECAAPPHPIGVVDVTVAGEVLLYEYVEPLVPRAAYPSSGPAGGGTVVAVEGSGFAFSTRLKCRFGWTEVPATFVSEAEVRCAAPPGDAGPTALAVSGNGQDFVDVPAGFAYEAAPVVHGVAPPLGFAGTLVTLTGAGLGGVSACLFGDASTPATVVSDTEVRCAAPAGAGSLAVGASVNGVDAYASAARFRYVARPEVLSLEPASAGVEGGATVVVRGLRFPDSSLLACRFGATTAAARWVNATELECEAPPADASGPVAVEVSANGADFTADGAAFAYAATATVTGAGPLSGPATGGTEVVVRGANLVFSPSLACRFAFFDVPASFVGPTELRCAAPAQSAGAAAFAVVDDRRVLYEATFEYTPLMAVRGASPPRGAAGTSVTVAGSGFAAYATAACVFGDRRVEAVVTSDTEVTCEAPPGEGDVAVRVVSGATTAAGEAIFTYARAPSVSNLRPSTAAAGEPVTIYGADFVDASELACVFGDATTQARYVSSTELVCIAPVNEGVVDVAVTVNGIDRGASSSTFTYASRDATYELRPRRLATKGGTIVTVRGPHLELAPSLACRFGVHEVPASVEAGALACKAPPLEVGPVAFRVMSDGRVVHSTELDVSSMSFEASPLLGANGTRVHIHVEAAPYRQCCVFGDHVVSMDDSICRAPPGQGRVLLRVAPCDAPDSDQDGLAWTYVANPIIYAVAPSIVSPSLDGSVEVIGAHFVDSTDLTCYASGKKVAARFVSSSKVVCDVSEEAGPGVALSISINGQDRSNALEVEIAPRFLIHDAAPSIIRPSTKSIEVRGAGFVASRAEALVCVMGDHITPVKYVSPSVVRCPVQGVSTTIKLCYEGLGCSNELALGRADAPVIDRAEPSVLSVNGGLVTFFGEGFEAEASCLFGDVVIKASRYDDDLVECAAPPLIPGAYSTKVVVGDASSSPETIRVAATPAVASVAPAVVSLSGGLVSIQGGAFPSDLEVLCAFGATIVQGRRLSSTSVSCAAPPFGKAGLVKVRAGFSPQTLSATFAELEYAPAGRIVDVAPTVIAAGASTELTLIGTNLRDVACRFDGVATQAQVIDMNEARCAVTGRAASVKALEVSLDGASYHNVEAITVVDSFALTEAEVIGDEVVVRGAFTDAITSCIYDDNEVVEATVRNATTVMCPASNAKRVQVGTSSGALSDSIRIATPKQFVVASVEVVDRGQTVRLGGANLVQREGLACAFGTVQTSVTKRGAHLECALPDSIARSGGSFSLLNAGRPPIYLVEPTVPKQPPKPTVFDIIRVGDALRVRGANFIHEDIVECLVAHTTLIGTHVSGNERACLDINDEDIGRVTIRLNGENVLTTPVDSSVTEEEDTPIDFRTLAVHPNLLSADQGGILTVRGASYPMDRKLFCRMDDLVLGGEALNTTSVLCRVPPLDRIGTFNISVEDALQRSAGSTSIRVLRDPSVASVKPTHVSRGDVVRIDGANFVEGYTSCKFDEDIVPAAFIDTRSISCVAPASATTLRVSNDGRAFSSSVALTSKSALVFDALVTERRVAPTDTTFSVNVDNVTCEPRCTCADHVCRTTSDRVCVLVDGVQSAHMCGYLSDIPIVNTPPNADKASPSVVAAGVATNVIVEGGAFANHKNLACLVNGTAVETTWLSPTQISCLVDAAPGSYDLSVSDGYATGVSTPIRVTSRVLVETLSSIAHVDDFVAATLSGSLNHTGASCTFDGNARPADVVDGTRIYCQSPSDEMRAAVTLTSAHGALPLRGAVPLEVSIKLPPLIHSVEPPLSPVGLSTMVTVRGNFASQRLFCRFGSVNTEASVLSESELRCPVPLTDTVRTVPFDVGYSRGEASPNAHAFAFYRQPRIASVLPRSATIGTDISIAIAAPDDLGGRYPAFAACRFGDSIVEAARPSSSGFACVVPSLEPGSYNLAVALDGASFSPSISFYVVDVPSVLSVEPASGSIQGGALIEVSGSMRGALLHTACLFDGVSSRALSATNGSVTCVVPRVTTPGSVQVRLAVHNIQSETSAPFEYVAPLYLRSVLPVRAPPRAIISLEVDNARDGSCLFGDVETDFNGLECAVPPISGVVDLRVKTGGDVSNALSFEVLDAVRLVSVLPNTGPTNGNTEVVIRGNGFERHHAVQCLWRRDGALVSVNATVSDVVRCLTPAFAQGPGVYDLSLSVDGVESESIQFEVRDTLELLTMDLDVATALGGAATLIKLRHLELPSSSSKCRFGSATVPATYWSANVVQCRVPAHATGLVNVSVSPDGVHFYGSLPLLYVAEPPQIIEVVPSTIYASDTSVDLVGRGFLPSKRLTCRFTGEDRVTETPATYNGDGAACRAPSFSAVVQASIDGIHWGPGVRLTVARPPVVSEMGPESGPENGAILTFAGANLVEAATDQAKCRFGDNEVDADVNDEGVSCRVPEMKPGTIPVLILPNGRDVVHTSSYTVKPRPSLLKAEPPTGTMTGGHVVTVHGSRLATLKSARCSFSGVLAAAEVVEGGLRCVQPPLDEGTYDLSIDSSLGLLKPALQYEVLSSVRVDSLAPSFGYSNTTVEVAGRFSDLEAPLTCLFGALEANASLVDDTSLRCAAPASSPKRVSLQIRDARGRMSQSLTYHYLPPLQIHAVSRGEAVEAGRDGVLTVTGRHFPDTPHLACRVDDMLYDATWMASHLMVCDMPSLAAQTTNYTVFVTANNVDFVAYEGTIEAAGAAPVVEEAVVDEAEAPVEDIGAVILAVAPRSAPASGGHSVSVHLSAPLQGVVACRFGDVETPARFITEEVATCATPVMTGDVLFSFVEDDAVIPFADGEREALFTLRGRSHAMRLSPSQGNEGTVVKIDVAGALAGPGRWRCRFGDSDVRGRVVASNKVACTVPAGTGTVKVTVAGPLVTDVFGTSDAVFEYIEAPRVLALSPKMGWTAGSYDIDARLSQNVESCACRFGDVFVDGTAISDIVRCRAPRLREGTTSVRVECGGRTLDPPHELRIRRPAEVFASSPARGSERGGSRVTLRGRNLPNVASLQCVFGGVSVPARWESDTKVTCEVPGRGYPGTVDVTLVADGLQAHSSSALFTYTQHSVVDSIEPVRSSHLGGQIIDVRGAFFDAAAKLRCSFGGLQVPASLVNATLLRCAAPARPPGLVTLQILVDGLVSNTFDFTYELTATAYAIVPSSGPALGGGAIRLVGANFDGKTRCCVNGIEVSTTYVSPTTLHCEAPMRTPGTIVQIHVCDDVARYEYAYFRPALALGASPSSGAEEGGTIVTVKTAFDENDGLRDVLCRFGDAAVNASRLDDTVRCVAPAGHGAVPLAVVYDANEYVEEATLWKYVKNLRITSIHPVNASVRGDSVVKVEGNGFDETSDIVCSFGGVEVDAIILDSTALVCVAPPLPLGFDTETWLSVESSMQPAVNNRVAFSYVDDASDQEAPLEQLPIVHGASPTVFGSYSRAQIRVTGEHFLPGALCRFGDQDGEGTYVSDTVVLCEAPPRIPSDVDLRVSVDSMHWSHTSVRLTYRRDASLISFEPSSGPLRGGTRVIITGRHFHAPASCFFGEVEVFASVTSDTSITCVAPAVARPSKIALSIEMGGVAVHAPSSFSYDSPPEIESIAPPSGPSAGGTRVILRGRRLGNQIWCRFGRETTKGAVLTRSRAYCTSPPHAAGDVSLEVSRNGRDFYGTHARFAYEAPLKLESVWPELAMGTLGGTTLTVRGTGFRETLGLSCDLDGTRSRAEVVSPTSILCMAPPHKAGLVSLRVSLHGDDVASNTLQVLYVDEPRVIEVFPDRGLSTGGYALFIEGTNFWNTSSIFCDLDGYKVRDSALKFPSISQLELRGDGVFMIMRASTRDAVVRCRSRVCS